MGDVLYWKVTEVEGEKSLKGADGARPGAGGGTDGRRLCITGGS